MAAPQGDIKKDVPDAVKTEPVTPQPNQEQRGGPGQRGGKRQRGGRWQGGRGGGFNQGGGGGGGFNQGGGNFNNQHQGGGGGFNNSKDGNNDNQNNRGGPQRGGGGGGDQGGDDSMGGGDMKRGGRGGNRFSGGGGPGGPGGNRDREFDRINERVMMISGQTMDLPPLDQTEKKFAGRNRLYVGNLSNDTTEDEIAELFKPFGETSELFFNKEKMFAFIRLDYHASAERAKRELDGQMRKGRPIKIRFAPNASSVRVKNLTPHVTNELLYIAFSVFGDIERCVVIVDERGRSTCEGIVEFARKPAALCALRRCQENNYFLTASLKPVIVESYEIQDDIDGFTEKGLGNKKSNDWYHAREVGPRFANPNSFEHEYGKRWKQLHELYKQKFEALKTEQQQEEEKLEAQMEYAKYEHETEMLREQLRAREMDKERQKREWEMKEQQVEEERRRGGDQMRRMQDDMMSRMNHQEEDLRRRQEENSLFLKAHQLNDMLDQQERYDTTVVSADTGNNQPEGNLPIDPKAFMDSFGKNDNGGNNGGIASLMDTRNNMGNNMGNKMGGGFNNRGFNNDNHDMRGNRGNWNNNMGGRRGGDDFQNKRRRF